MFCIQSFFFFSLEEIIILKWVLHSQKAVSQFTASEIKNIIPIILYVIQGPVPVLKSQVK